MALYHLTDRFRADTGQQVLRRYAEPKNVSEIVLVADGLSIPGSSQFGASDDTEIVERGGSEPAPVASQPESDDVKCKPRPLR